MEQHSRYVLSTPSAEELAIPRVAQAWLRYAQRHQQIHGLEGTTDLREDAPVVAPPELDAQLINRSQLGEVALGKSVSVAS